LDTIFTVTTIQAGAYISGGCRTVGWFKTEEEAKEIVENNCGDIYECGYYQYAVVEEYESGLYIMSYEKQWYRWNKEQEKYEPIRKPSKFNRICNYAIG
jgi:hypothetical protein